MLRGRRAAIAVAVLTFCNATVWALVTPPFEGPDEDAHAAYAAHLAETGEPPSPGSSRPFASSELRLAMEASGHFLYYRLPKLTRPPWSPANERRLALGERRQPSRSDGGGSTSAAAYGPVYYAAAAAGYRLAGGSVFSRLFGMRLVSALLAALTALAVTAAVAELVPGRRWPSLVGGLLVGFQPMFGFVSGVVTDDAAANLAGALALYLVLRALRRGLHPGTAVALAATLSLGVIAKPAVLALVPAAVVGVGLAARRHGVATRTWAALIATIGAVVGAWAALSTALERAALTVATQSTATGRSHATFEATPSLADHLGYLWQVFLPRLPFMNRIYDGPDVVPGWTVYVRRLWGSFGWLSVEFPGATYKVIALILLAVAVLAVRTLLIERRAVRARRAELATLALALVSVMLSTHYAFARVNLAPYVAEQGRYLFPVAVVGAVFAIGACYGLGRRWAPVAGTAMAVAMILASGLSQLFVFTRYFT